MRDAPQTWRWGQSVDQLIEMLDRGGMLAVPTESSYGLAVDPRSGAGVATVYRFKKRSIDRPLPVVLGEPAQLELLGGEYRSPELAELLQLWPAPLTVVTGIRQPLPASAGRCSLAVRVPAHEELRSLLLALGRPLTATSANRAGRAPVTRPDSLRRMLSGWPCVIVDDGVLPGGAPSTIVEPCGDGYRVLRVGAIPPRRLQAQVSRPVFSAEPAEIPADESPQTP